VRARQREGGEKGGKGEDEREREEKPYRW